MQRPQQTHTKTLRSFNALGPCANVFMSANTGSWRLERPKVDYDACIRCGICKKSCPADIIEVHKEGVESVTFDWNYCKGCGICANECPKHCITMVDERGEA
ncbi:MAG: 4Fe-4S binding protein [Clostridia bacterium]|nr:4Fe-4S binding protein [Clostridia bacterium]